MSDRQKKTAALAVVFGLILGLSVFYCAQKSGMFLDEVYSYGLSNSEYAPFVSGVKGGDLANKLFTHEEILAYLTAGPEDAFDYGSVYYNQTQDVHPPLYYWLVHTVCSLWPSVFSKWQGLALNLLLWLGTLVLLFFTAKRLTDFRAALLAVLLYGVSTVGLSTVVYIRMYMLLALFTVLLTYCVIRLMQGGRRYWSALAGLTVFAGLMTQYYFVFYAFFVCALLDAWLLAQKRWRTAAGFSAWALAGAAAMVLAFPACLTHLQVHGLGEGKVGAASLRTVLISLYTFFRQAAADAAVGLGTAVLAGVLLLLHAGAAAGQIKKTRTQGQPVLVVCGAAVLAFAAVAAVTTNRTLRYIYNLFPLLYLGAGYLVYLAFRALPQKRRLLNGAWLAAALLAAAVALLRPPQWLYLEYRQFDAALAAHKDAPCVFLSDDRVPAMTAELPQLLWFDDVFVADGSTPNEALDAYLAGHAGSEVVVFVSVYLTDVRPAQLWLAGLEGGQSAILLNTNEFAQVYLLPPGNAAG